MPQGPFNTNVAVQDVGGANVYRPMNLDADGNLLVAGTGSGGATPVEGAVTVATDGTDPSTLLTSPQGATYVAGPQNATLNVTTAAVIKANPGRLRGILVVAAPASSGALTINNLTATSGGTAANTLCSIPYNASTMVAGAFLPMDIPATVGIAVTAVGGGSPVYVILWD